MSSISTRIKKKVDKVETIKYPCILKSKYNDSLVLFTDYGVGVCIHGEPEAITPPGLHFGSFENVYNMDAFTPFEGEVTICVAL